ncbi:MAG: substrate-binding periplasmic protein [Spirochaetia bacterium]
MNKIFKLIVVLLFTGCVFLSAQEITLATGEWPPYTGESLENHGFFTEIVNAVFEEMGVDYTLVFVPWARAESLVESGRAWAAFPYSVTEERQARFNFSNSVTTSESKFFYYENAPIADYEGLDSLEGFRLAGVRGYFYESAFNEAGLQVQYVDNQELAFNLLHAGRAELFPINEIVGWQYIQEAYPNSIQNFGTLDSPYSSNSLSMMVSRDYPDTDEILQRFNQALRRMIDRGEVQAILDRYIGN